MAHPMRIDVLRSVAEAAGMTMAPASDQFDAEPNELIADIGAQTPPVSMDAGNYSRSWARPLFRDNFPESKPRTSAITLWLKGRRTRIIST